MFAHGDVCTGIIGEGICDDSGERKQTRGFEKGIIDDAVKPPIIIINYKQQ